MDKTSIKTFAIWARNKLIADIQYRAGLMGITTDGIKNALPQSTKETEFYDIGTAEPYAITGEAIRQRRSLVDVINQKANETNYQTAYKYIIEGVAYTWFNRLIAVRFMEVNDYLPSHIRVLSSDSGKMEPDLVTTPFDADLPFTDEEKQAIIQFKNDNKLDDCFRMLFIKQCNALNEILPALFEKTSDYTELLLNISAIDKDGVVYHLVNDIAEDDFNIEKGGQVEIIGWLYQYYNTEPKNEAFAKSGKITKEEIPAVTQLFTPDWIVRYMVENSLGRLWVEGHSNDLLKSKWKYYLEEAEQEPEVQTKLEEIHKEYSKLNPEDIHFIDPCMGSGHILVYAFDVLMQIYETAGYSERDAAKSILENNLYGLDIDDRAYQMAYFAVMMKARQYNRLVLEPDTVCHVYSIQDSNSINRNQLKYFGLSLNEMEKNDALNQINGLLDTFKDAKEYGSILNVENYNWDLLRRFASDADVDGQMTLDAVGIPQTQERIKLLIEIGETMARKYEAVVTNPPYMGNGGMDELLTAFTKKYYPDSKTDMFAVCTEKCSKYTKENGFYSMIVQPSILTLNSFSKLRQKLLKSGTIYSLLHMGRGIFGVDFGSTAYTFRNCHVKDYYGTYFKLHERTFQFIDPKDIEALFLMSKDGKMKFDFSTYSTERGIDTSAIDNDNGKSLVYIRNSDSFFSIPDVPYTAYELNPLIIDLFDGNLISSNVKACVGMRTGDNDRFLRMWHEVGLDRELFNGSSAKDIIGTSKKWIPYNKGGDYRKWYGNQEYVVNWEEDGLEIKENTKKVYPQLGDNLGWKISNEPLYGKPHIAWSDIASRGVSFRYFTKGFIFDASANVAFADENEMGVLGYINSAVVGYLSKILNPTMHFKLGNFNALPYKPIENHKVDQFVEENIKLSKDDWESYETSWDFKKHPLI